MQDTLAIILQHEEESRVFPFGNIRLMVAVGELNVWDAKRNWHKIDKEQGEYMRFAQDSKGNWQEIDTDGTEESLIAAINAHFENAGAEESYSPNITVERDLASYHEALHRNYGHSNF